MSPPRAPLPNESFPSTRWSRILTRETAGKSRRDALENLASQYFRPVLAYIRSSRALAEPEAQDAAQEFFLWVLESDWLDRADRDRGSFRGFVKTSLRNFLHDLDRKRQTTKRGGKRVFVTLDDPEQPLPLPDQTQDPDAVLDDLWRKETLSKALESLERDYAQRGKDRVFLVFRDYYLSENELDYEGMASRFGISKTDVSNYLMDAKGRFRSHLREVLLETVQSDDDLRAELAWLFSEEAS